MKATSRVPAAEIEVIVVKSLNEHLTARAGKWPETFGEFASKLAELGVRRAPAELQKPANGGPFCYYRGWFPGRPDWLAGDAVLIAPISNPNSLLTGKFAILGPKEATSEQETAATQPLLKQFPAQINRENISHIREFSGRNREFQPDKRPIGAKSALLPKPDLARPESHVRLVPNNGL